MRTKGVLVVGIALYLLAWAVMHVPSMVLLQGESIEIAGPEGRPCLGTVWEPSKAAPRAVLLAGHGVTANRGIMSMLAGVFARNGYAVVAIDFWGHGRSREAFDWNANPDQIEAWCAWVRKTYPGLPLAYLGYSMGGFAGAEVFRDKNLVEVFVALGALPRHELKCPTLIAAGKFEELFNFEQARKYVEAYANTGMVTSPFSDHALEAHDPVLISRILNWVDGRLGFTTSPSFPWMHWFLTMLALVLGTIAVLIISTEAITLFKREPESGTSRISTRSWSLNPYRIAGFLLGCRGTGSPPKNASFLYALAGGLTFSAILILLLSSLLNRHIFTCSLNHPERLLTWGILFLILAGPLFFDAWVLERLPLTRGRKRFAAAALTRAVPLIIASILLHLMGPGIAFSGMMFGILAFILVMLSLVYALAIRSVADWRAGAIASAVIFAWLIAFWFPLSWPWL